MHFYRELFSCFIRLSKNACIFIDREKDEILTVRIVHLYVLNIILSAKKIMNSKIHCPLYGLVTLSQGALKIVLEPEFQRLKKIKQMGASYCVFPKTIHSRFEHSIGVYHLTSIVMNHLASKYPKKKYFIPELDNVNTVLTARIIELVKIAGLCHDIGHGPFSHLFDDKILCGINHPHQYHEIRSCLIVKKIFDNCFIKQQIFTEQEVKFIMALIYPDNQGKKNPLYRIISDQITGIDVDRLDYLIRDSYYLGLKNNFNPLRIIYNMNIIDNEIVYHENCLMDILNFFQTRFNLHVCIYTCAAIKTAELMLTDHIENSQLVHVLDDMDKFCRLTDENFDMSGLFMKKKYIVIAEIQYLGWKNNLLYTSKQLGAAVNYDALETIFFKKMEKFIQLYSEKYGTPCYLFEIISVRNKLSNTNTNPLEDVLFCNSGTALNIFNITHDFFEGKNQEARCILVCKKQEYHTSALIEWEIYNKDCKL